MSGDTWEVTGIGIEDVKGRFTIKRRWIKMDFIKDSIDFSSSSWTRVEASLALASPHPSRLSVVQRSLDGGHEEKPSEVWCGLSCWAEAAFPNLWLRSHFGPSDLHMGSWEIAEL